MEQNVKKLGEAELEIMQVIWKAGEPLTSNFILQALRCRRQWQLSTLMTSLSRLADKGFVRCSRETGQNLYTAVVTEEAYKSRESKNFLEKVFGNSLQNMVATLYSSRSIQDSDVEELRKFLDELEADQR